MDRPCQLCGRPARFLQPLPKAANRVKMQHRSHHMKARDDHDLCPRCWRKLLDAVDARQLEEEYGERITAS